MIYNRFLYTSKHYGPMYGVLDRMTGKIVVLFYYHDVPSSWVFLGRTYWTFSPGEQVKDRPADPFAPCRQEASQICVLFASIRCVPQQEGLRLVAKGSTYYNWLYAEGNS